MSTNLTNWHNSEKWRAGEVTSRLRRSLSGKRSLCREDALYRLWGRNAIYSSLFGFCHTDRLSGYLKISSGKYSLFSLFTRFKNRLVVISPVEIVVGAKRVLRFSGIGVGDLLRLVVAVVYARVAVEVVVTERSVGLESKVMRVREPRQTWEKYNCCWLTAWLSAYWGSMYSDEL